MKMNVYRRALVEGTGVIREVGPADLDRPTPCVGWDLRALLEHMIGQNHGFAEALERAGAADVPATAFAPRSFDDDGLVGSWQASADRVEAAFGSAAPDAEVLLAEVSTQQRVPAATVLAMHLLDTAVHTWDVATALGRRFRPEDEVAGAVAEVAPMVPEGPSRELSGAAFAPRVAVAVGGDPWTTTLATLGRDAQRDSS